MPQVQREMSSSAGFKSRILRPISNKKKSIQPNKETPSTANKLRLSRKAQPKTIQTKKLFAEENAKLHELLEEKESYVRNLADKEQQTELESTMVTLRPRGVEYLKQYIRKEFKWWRQNDRSVKEGSVQSSTVQEILDSVKTSEVEEGLVAIYCKYRELENLIKKISLLQHIFILEQSDFFCKVTSQNYRKQQILSKLTDAVNENLLEEQTSKEAVRKITTVLRCGNQFSNSLHSNFCDLRLQEYQGKLPKQSFHECQAVQPEPEQRAEQGNDAGRFKLKFKNLTSLNHEADSDLAEKDEIIRSLNDRIQLLQSNLSQLPQNQSPKVSPSKSTLRSSGSHEKIITSSQSFQRQVNYSDLEKFHHELKSLYKEQIESKSSKITQLQQQVIFLNQKVQAAKGHNTSDLGQSSKQGLHRHLNASNSNDYSSFVQEEFERMRKGFAKKLEAQCVEFQQQEKKIRGENYQLKEDLQRIEWEKKLVLKKYEFLSSD